MCYNISLVSLVIPNHSFICVDLTSVGVIMVNVGSRSILSKVIAYHAKI